MKPTPRRGRGARPTEHHETLPSPAESANLEHAVPDIVCAACGCLCDDVEIRYRQGQVAEVIHACPIGERSFRRSPLDQEAPLAAVAGKPVSLNQAREATLALLRPARRVAIDGLENLNVESQRVALQLAKILGATVIGSATRAQARVHRAALDAGCVTCTLGEVRQRADVVVLWNSRPSLTHPRHFERYSLDPPGRFVPRGRQDRTLVVVGSASDADIQADYTLPLADGRDLEAAWVLRAIVKGLPLDPLRVHRLTGITLETWTELANLLTRARYGVVIHDPSASPIDRVEDATRAVLHLVTDLNSHTSFAYVPLAPAGNAAGLEQIIGWTTGQSGSIDFAAGEPRALPYVDDLGELLVERSTDAVLLVDCDPLADAEPSVWQHLGHLPAIVLGSRFTSTAASASVFFRIAPLSDLTGSVFRSDGVCLPTRPAPVPSGVDPLTLLQELVDALSPAGD
jgi:formylmethanofuran dehydrogenase subunit B